MANGTGGAAAGELVSRIFAETALEVFLEAKGRSETGNQEQDQTTVDSGDDVTILLFLYNILISMQVFYLPKGFFENLWYLLRVIDIPVIPFNQRS